jgi:hypothetical protein
MVLTPYYEGQRDLQEKQEEDEEASSLQSRIIALLNIGKGHIGAVPPPIKVIQRGVMKISKRDLFIMGYSQDTQIHPSIQISFGLDERG